MKNEGDRDDQAGVIGVIRQEVIGVIRQEGFEADQHDSDRVSSDQGFLIGDRGAIGQIRDN